MNQSKSILWLIPARNAPWYHELAKSIIELTTGYNLTIVSFDFDQTKPFIEKKKTRITYHSYSLNSRKSDLLSLKILSLKKMKKIISLYTGYDIIHIHGTEHQYQAAVSHINVPKVTSIQGIIGEYVKHVKWRNYKTKMSWMISTYYEKKFLQTSANFFCRTHWDKEFVKKNHPSPNIHHSWEIIRTEFFDNHYNQEAKNLLFMGGMNPLKGYSDLIKAFSLINNELGVGLIIVGCDRKKVIKYLKSKGLSKLEKSVTLYGHLSSKEILEQYKKSFALVHPSLIDNSPNTICEAQISGLPVIATDVGGVSSLITHEKTGYLIEKGALNLANGIKKLYLNHSLRQKISKKSREISRKRHDPKKIVETTIKVYEQMMRENN